MKYRSHRGSLSDSMETEVEVNTLEELIAHINSLNNDFDEKFSGKVEELKFEHVGMDERIGWDTYYVLVKGLYPSQGIGFVVAGMSDGKF